MRRNSGYKKTGTLRFGLLTAAMAEIFEFVVLRSVPGVPSLKAVAKVIASFHRAPSGGHERELAAAGSGAAARARV